MPPRLVNSGADRKTMQFTKKTASALGYYVYALIDPRDSSIFYVGRAKGNGRAYSHLKEVKGEKRKHQRIQEIRATGKEPKVDILRYGLTADSCGEVEAAIIDTIGLENLTNEIRGHGVERGRQSANEVERLYGAKPKPVEDILEPCMLFFINRTYSPTKSEIELYDCVRQFWSGVGKRTRTPDPATGALPYRTALAVVDGVVVRAYTIEAWFVAGATMSSRTATSTEGKYEFVGKGIPDHPLVGLKLTENGEELNANEKGYSYLPRRVVPR